MERTDFEHWKAKEVARLLALVETERRYYQEMVASLPVALVVLSLDRSIVSANRAFRQMFGVRTEDLRRKTIEQILNSPQLIEKIRDVHSSNTPQRSILVEFADRPLRITVIPIRNWDDENEVETLLMLEDTAGWVNAQPIEPAKPMAAAAPPASADIPAILWQADVSSMVFTSVSGAVEAMLGYPASHWLSTPRFFIDRIHPEDRAATMAFYDGALENAGNASAEFRALTSAGRVLWCRETIRVTGRRLISGVLTDITLRKQLEEQLLTAERSDALHALSSRLAHDLNNPLMIIAGYAEEMLHAVKPEDPMRADVEQILGATQRISGITGQLLGYTRRLAAPAARVDVAAVIAKMEDRIAKAAGEGVTVEIAPVSDPVWAMADAAQIEEMMLALVSPQREDAKGRSRVMISCAVESIAEQLPESTLPPGEYARVTVRDNGRGIEASRRMEIFEAVLPKDAAGAALARAYSTAREWGGDLAFSSQPSRGSAFTIYLPFGSAPLPEATPAPVSSPVTVPTEAPMRETILLVEDEAGIRALVRKILKRERYNVLEAGSGEEASRVAGSFDGKIDLLLTDVMLPGMSGRDLAEDMREALPEVSVLYVSGFTDDESVRAGGFPPGSKFLQKPFTLSALVQKVREALES
jgi:two-component system cell cycle sensor histidine kinase/response regulator CckA